jgi:hypothetical protein
MEAFIKLRRFFDTFKTLNFWQRIFSWRTIVSQSYEAYEELIQCIEDSRKLQGELDELRRERDALSQQKNAFKEQMVDLRDNLIKADARMQYLELQLQRIEKENVDLQRKVDLTEQKDEQRRRENDRSMQHLLNLKEQVQKEMADVQTQKLREVEEKNRLMKETWRRHEDTVQSTIKAICERHAITYVEEVPFKGKPDNVIRICDELIVFDAKSPASDDLGNFNAYIRSQAEAASKYATHEGVRKDIYLVVPSNTVDVLKKISFNHGNFNVYVITLDALEPVILSLKKLEEYEFAEQLSPEDRQSICRIIGSLIYTSKRRIQVDQFFNGELLELLLQAQRNIPETMQEDIARHEKAMKLNPSVDRRSKEISHATLEKTQSQLAGQGRLLEIMPEGVELALVVNG